jgi:ABC-2 type transport system ATP-binding protein
VCVYDDETTQEAGVAIRSRDVGTLTAQEFALERNRRGPSEVPALVLREVTKAWGRGEPRLTVLDDVELSLAPGTVVWIGGRNGVGKTTLLRIAAGMIAPDRGTVKLSGLDPIANRRQYQRRVGFLSAGDRGLYPRLSVRRHLDFWSRIAFVPRSHRQGLIDATLRRFELTELAERRADRLSLGQRQRLRLALSLLHEPQLLLLDEPLNSLDSHGAALLRKAVDEHRLRGGITFWCSPAGIDNGMRFDSSFVLEQGHLNPA